MGSVPLLNFLAGALAVPISVLLIIRFLNKTLCVINHSLYIISKREGLMKERKCFLSSRHCADGEAYSSCGGNKVHNLLPP